MYIPYIYISIYLDCRLQGTGIPTNPPIRDIGTIWAKMDRYRLTSNEILTSIVIFHDLYAQNSKKSVFEQKKEVGLQPELGVGICCKWIVGDRLYGYVCRFSIHHYGFHNNGVRAGARARLLWRRPKAASTRVDGKAANIAIQHIPNDSLTTYTHTKFRL